MILQLYKHYTAGHCTAQTETGSWAGPFVAAHSLCTLRLSQSPLGDPCNVESLIPLACCLAKRPVNRLPPKS